MSEQQVVEIRGQVEWYSKFDPEGNQWLAVCPSLNLNACGDTFQDMVEHAHTVTRLLWDDLMEDGDFEEFLRERHLTFEKRWLPQPASQSKPRVDVPYRMTPTDDPLVELVAT